tara:strand:+ start:6074 stop:6850 length:777 start_codon:yes stop_codon:yes gene_type:complete
MNDYHFEMPGRIVEYFPSTQTATVKISNDRTFDTSSDTDMQVTPGLLYDVPVFTSGGGGWHTTYPIKANDPCKLSFSQFGYDHWLYDNSDAAGIRADGHPQPWTRRKFDLNDGFAQVGWNNIPTAISGYSANDAEFRNADNSQRVTLKAAGHIEIVSGSTTIVLSKDGEVTITATQVDVITPLATFSGDVTVAGDIDITGATTSTGLITGAGGLGISGGSGAAVTGDLITTGDVVASGTSLSGHTHTDSIGGSTSPPS